MFSVWIRQASEANDKSLTKGLQCKSVGEWVFEHSYADQFVHGGLSTCNMYYVASISYMLM